MDKSFLNPEISVRIKAIKFAEETIRMNKPVTYGIEKIGDSTYKVWVESREGDEVGLFVDATSGVKGMFSVKNCHQKRNT